MFRRGFQLTAASVVAALLVVAPGAVGRMAAPFATVDVAHAQGSERLAFLDDLFGNSQRSPQSTPAQAAPPAATGRVAQVPGAELSPRLDRLEAQIRQLTGAIEQLQYRNQQLEGQIRRMQDPGSGRLPVTPQQGQPQSPPPAVQPPGRRGDVFDPAQNPNAPGAPRVLGTLPSGSVAPANPRFEDEEIGAPGGRSAGAPLDLSTLAGAAAAERIPPSQPGITSTQPLPPPQRPQSGPAPQVATLPPSDSPRDNYDLAYGYIMRKDYALAEEGFRNFLRRFPGDRLIPDAQYWLGESMFQRQRYRDAAESFLSVSTKFETSARAPDALLRLGQSLAQLGEREAACASLAEVLRKYPRASVAVRQGVEREQKRVRC